MILKKRILAVILCRSDSKRLNGKIFKKINNKSVLENLILNIKSFEFIDQLIIASPNLDKNKKKIAQIAKKNSIRVFFGKKNNVLDRLIKASKIFDYDFLLRLNADNPFVSKKVIRKSLMETIQGNYDVSTYAFSNSIPFGLSAVIFKKKILEKINRLTDDKRYLEHVENFCFINKKKFKIHYQEIKKNNFYFYNCSIDNIEDLIRVKKIFVRNNSIDKLEILKKFSKTDKKNYKKEKLNNIKKFKKNILKYT